MASSVSTTSSASMSPASALPSFLLRGMTSEISDNLLIVISLGHSDHDERSEFIIPDKRLSQIQLIILIVLPKTLRLCCPWIHP